MQHKDQKSPIQGVKPTIPRSKRRKIIYSVVGIILLLALAGIVLVTSFPNTIIHYAVEPKLKQFITERLGRRYSLEINSIALTSNKDSLILTGVRIIDNGKAEDESTDTTSPNFGVALPLDRLSTDTVIIAALDYWKLILQKGLFAGTISIRSPKIFLRPGALPKFAQNTGLLPSFLPAVSSKIIKIENAKVYFSEGKPRSNEALYYDGSTALPANVGGLLVKNASLEFHDFYLDEPTYKKALSTFFCKSATFHAEDISHVDSLGITDIDVESVNGDLIDSSMSISNIVARKPIEEIRKTSIRQIEFSGLDWSAALAGHGFHARNATITNPQIALQDISQINTHPNYASHLSASDLIPLPSLLPSIELQSVNITNAEIYALLPQSHSISALKRITMSLHQFRVDSSTPFANISTFFSERANYGIKGKSSISTSLGNLKFGQMDGTEKTLKILNVDLEPTVKGLQLIRLSSAEVSGINIWKLLMREGVFSSSLTLRNPKIYLSEKATSPITSFDSIISSDPFEKIRQFKEYPLPLLLPIASFGSVNVFGGSLYGIHFLDDPNNLKGRGDSIMNLQISLKNFKLNQNSWINKRGMLFSDAGTFQIGAMTQQTPGAIYRYSEGGIKGDLRKHSLTIDSVIVHPLIPEDSFGSAFKFRTERINLFAPHISIEGLDYQSLLLGKGLYVDSVKFFDWSLHVYGDRRRPEAPRTSIEKYPHEIFQQVRIPLGIKSVGAYNGNISFRESWPDTTEPGTITMTHVNVRIGEISNDTMKNGLSKVTPITGDLKIMNQGLVRFNLDYKLMNPVLDLKIYGDAGSMDASLLNNYLALTEPFTLSGVVRSAQFNIELKNNLMTGTLVPQYDSLHVKFFRWDKFPPGFVSFLANALFMRSHNIPALDHPLHSGEISSDIDRNVSLFWAVWLPIRSAIGSVVRIPEWVW